MSSPTVVAKLLEPWHLRTTAAAVQVAVLAAQAARVQAELEAVFGKVLRSHPLTAPLGAPGSVKYVVWAVLAAPLVALLLPLGLLPVRRLCSCPPGAAGSCTGIAFTECAILGLALTDLRSSVSTVRRCACVLLCARRDDAAV